MPFNHWTREVLELREGEDICPNCKGNGVVITSLVNVSNMKIVCPKCFGHGKLDWIEKVTRKNDLAIGIVEF